MAAKTIQLKIKLIHNNLEQKFKIGFIEILFMALPTSHIMLPSVRWDDHGTQFQGLPKEFNRLNEEFDAQ